MHEQKEGRGGILGVILWGFRIPLVVLILLIVLIVSITALVTAQTPSVLALFNPEAKQQQEADNLISEVSKLISLPAEERPTVATVTDAEKIKEQQFFRNAQNGDRVLIYSASKKVILYRPSEKRIIEVGAINIGQQASPAPTPKVQIEETKEEESTPSPTPSPEPSATPASEQ